VLSVIGRRCRSHNDTQRAVPRYRVEHVAFSISDKRSRARERPRAQAREKMHHAEAADAAGPHDGT